jgi:hypothetical protein
VTVGFLPSNVFERFMGSLRSIFSAPKWLKAPAGETLSCIHKFFIRDAFATGVRQVQIFARSVPDFAFAHRAGGRSN